MVELLRLSATNRPISFALFDCLNGENDEKLYPKENRKEIDEMCAYLFENVNNGVYKAGFAQSQATLDDAVDKLFQALDVLDQKLERSKFLLGVRLSDSLRYLLLHHPNPLRCGL